VIRRLRIRLLLGLFSASLWITQPITKFEDRLGRFSFFSLMFYCFFVVGGVPLAFDRTAGTDIVDFKGTGPTEVSALGFYFHFAASHGLFVVLLCLMLRMCLVTFLDAAERQYLSSLEKDKRQDPDQSDR